jgi:hypothetical protein
MQLIKEQPRYQESFEFHQEITRPFGDLDTVLAWCRTELQGDWRWQLIEVSTDRRPGFYKFYFDLEKDYCTFLLKWA